MIITRRAALTGMALAAAAAPAWSAPPAWPILSAQDTHDVARAVAYLEGLATAEGRFVQTDARGGESRGTVVIQRPGKARFDYDPPSGLVIVSDGHRVTVVDRRLKTMHTYPLGATPLGLFLAAHIRLDRGVRVTQVTRLDHGLQMLAVDGLKKARGSVLLDFSGPPLALSGWTVTDARGGRVTVRLTGFAPAARRDAAFFILSDPKADTAE